MLKASPVSWRQIQAQNFRSIDKLAVFLQLSPEQRARLVKRQDFSLNLPRRLAEKMRKGELTDPLLRQFVPLDEEKKEHAHFLADPVGDQESRQAPRLLHKYHGRALLVCTAACAMHCRYCFRQHFDYAEGGWLAEELAYLREDESIEEAILSGGDPLSLSDQKLGALLDALNALPHLKRIRFHSRFPVGIPERIDADFLGLLQQLHKQVFFVLHSNHPRELDTDVLAAMRKLQELGIPVLNQSVLLKGVNDDADTLTQLYSCMVDHGILPYYLHQLDRVQGAAHFEVPVEKGRLLIEALHARLPGYAVPIYAREDAGASGKTRL